MNINLRQRKTQERVDMFIFAKMLSSDCFLNGVHSIAIWYLRIQQPKYT